MNWKIFTSVIAVAGASGFSFALALSEKKIASTDEQEVCGFQNGLSYSKRHRSDNYSLRHEIRQRDACDPRDSEVDHYLPLSLGGADTHENLWCQPGTGTWTYHDKDRLEVYYWEQVCKHHAISLRDAQAVFSGPWEPEYCKVFSTDTRCIK